MTEDDRDLMEHEALFNPQEPGLTVEHFLIVRVRQPRYEDPRKRTPLAAIRMALHDAMQEYNLDAGDIVLRGDRERDNTGMPTRHNYGLIQALYYGIQERHRAWAAGERRGRPLTAGRYGQTAEERTRREHRARATRALAVVTKYIETYEDDLPAMKPRGKHAA